MKFWATLRVCVYLNCIIDCHVGFYVILYDSASFSLKMQNVKAVFDAAIKLALYPPKSKKQKTNRKGCNLLWFIVFNYLQSGSTLIFFPSSSPVFLLRVHKKFEMFMPVFDLSVVNLIILSMIMYYILCIACSQLRL